MGNPNPTRRDFLGTAAGTAALAAAFTILPRHVLGGPRHVAPSEKLNIAGIGVAHQGGHDVANCESENIVALCDVDPDLAAPTFKKYPQAKIYADYRQMLEQQKDIDAVVIGTPDHTHAVIAAAAMRAGKHVYCEKPLCHDIYEARTLARIARETGVTTQMGIQGHSGEGLRLICEWIADGAIGTIREVDAWCSLSYYPWGHEYWSSTLGRRPTEKPAVPPNLNWDLWLGPAPERPYHPTYHPARWRAWWDFGNGMMGDRGAHTLDSVFMALKLGMPTSIDATSCGLNADTHPLSAIVTYQFPARGDLPPLKLTWFEGTRPPRPAELEDGRSFVDPEGGVLFKGDKGKIMCGVYGQSPRIIPESAMQAYKRPAKTLERIKGGHHQDWIRACKEGKPAGAHFEYAAALTEICLLGNLAKRVDGRIDWDAAAMKVTNNADANKFVKTEYRQGWSL